MTKNELRKTYLAARKQLASPEIKRRDEQIAALFFAGFNLEKIKFLHCFLPIKKFAEVNTPIIIHRIWREFPNVKTVVPRVDFQSREMENLKFSARNELKLNRWLIDEPTHDEIVESALIDMVLIPLLAFDKSGFRVGYGKGFYDKFLKNCRADCLKIGLSFFPPVEKIADVNDFDKKLNFCVTAEKIWQFV